jgi:hypothetical protein
LAGGFADVAATWRRAHMSALSLSLFSPILYLTLSLSHGKQRRVDRRRHI